MGSAVTDPDALRAYYASCRLAKPEPRKRTKGREDRAETKTKRQVRSECVKRDGYCRVSEMMRSPCAGPSEWAHLEDKRRSFTRGMQATDRHDTRWTTLICRHHHELYDAHTFDIHFQDEDRGADGPLDIRWR